MKKLKLDETGDSDDLQALFDSIASETPQKVRLEVVPEAVNSVGGDSADLEALFDTVATEYTTSHAVDESHELEHSCENVFNKVGHLARQLHDTLRQLGYDHALEDVAQQMPDARSRLNYVAQMTENAASRVLNATDVAVPLQDDGEKRVTAPLSLIVSAFATVPDARGTLTPQLHADPTDPLPLPADLSLVLEVA